MIVSTLHPRQATPLTPTKPDPLPRFVKPVWMIYRKRRARG